MNDRTTLRTTPTTTQAKRFLGFAATLSLAASLLAGCSNSVSTGSIIASAAVDVPVLITDAPADQLVSFSLTLNTIVLTDSAGKTVSILSAPTTIEVCHLNGVQAPLLTAKIPQDTYTSATFTFSNPQITYINSAGAAVVATPTLATTSYTHTFSSPIAISNSSTSLLIDLLANQSVTISGTTVTVTPVFALRPLSAATAVPPMGQNATGMEGHGAVVSASGTTLVIQPPSGPTVTFTTNSSTVMQGFTALSGLTAGQLVEVDFTVQTGGVLLASRIELEPAPPNGLPQNLISGPVTSVSIPTFKMIATQGLGPSMGPVSATAVTVFNVTTSSSTAFAITRQFGSLSGLPFTPSFSPTNLVAGQTVGVIASSISGNTATASNVTLVPQTLSGTVTAKATSGGYNVYTLTLASGSAFATLSGATTVTVYTSSATVPMATNAIAAGSNVRFNGLVFNLGGGKFAMVAGCSPDGDPRI
ncbi:MAG TPA: DUF5666 domain-containing protein [Acidobacteriaceae bacterium]|jgi:hypothetical protein